MHHGHDEQYSGDVYRFVDEYIDSFISWDILIYFHRKPGAIETSASLASRLGRNESDVEPEVDRLIKKGVLTAASGGTVKHDPTPELAERIAEFNEALLVASTRMTILGQVLGKRSSKDFYSR
jgi:hypothetical protein